jgi:predicted RNA-binding Zn-ribbon protein involved in translation (DUF1610 family)
MRRFYIRGQCSNFLREKPQAGFAGGLFAGRKHGLQAKTDSEYGNACFVCGVQTVGEIAFAQTCDECGKVANARKNNCLRVGDVTWFSGAFRFRAERSQGALD